MKNSQTYRTDPALADLRASLSTIREQGPRTLLKAARFDGAHAHAWLYNSYVTVSDEPGYLAALGQLRSLFDSLENDEQARHILKALRLGEGFPQILRTDPTHGIVCEAIV